MIQQWKPELKALGFAFKNNVFRYAPSEAQPVKFDVSVQKNLRDESFKINLSAVVKNPFADQPDSVILMGNLRPGGVSLHVPRDAWWPPEALPQALEALKVQALPWFERHKDPSYLAELLERAIKEKSDVVHILEPADPGTSALPWAPPRTPKVGFRLYNHASLLHYFAGNRQKAIERTNDWLAALPPTNPERAWASAQLQALTRPN